MMILFIVHIIIIQYSIVPLLGRRLCRDQHPMMMLYILFIFLIYGMMLIDSWLW